jgi:DNA-binding transcriptional MerR regulator
MCTRCGFLRRARDLGFSIKEIGVLPGLWNDRRRASADVKMLAARHMRELDEKIRELQQMREALAHPAQHCRGDGCPDCPILADLSADDASLPEPMVRKRRPRMTVA